MFLHCRIHMTFNLAPLNLEIKLHCKLTIHRKILNCRILRRLPQKLHELSENMSKPGEIDCYQDRLRGLARKKARGIVVNTHEFAPCKRIREGPGFWILDSGFQPFGFWIPTFWIPDSIPKRWIPDSKTIVDSGFQSLDSGFQQQKLAGFRIPDSLTWGEHILIGRWSIMRMPDMHWSRGDHCTLSFC